MCLLTLIYQMKEQSHSEDMKMEVDEEEPNYDLILQKKDFFPKIFLQPSEIKLDKQEGLKVIKRNMNRPDHFVEEAVKDITIDQGKIKTYTDIKGSSNPAGDGLLSLFKKTRQRRIKLAICICVYSEPKHMLKNTIKGIQQSYKHFLIKAGILPHEIIITVIFDGIEKINNSKDQTENMISFFKEIDIKNGFLKKNYGKSIDQYFKDLEQKNFTLSKMEEENLDDQFNIFTGEEMNQLQPKLFQNQYEEFTRIKGLLEETERLKKKKKIKLDSLPPDINKKYEEVCYNFCVQNNIYYETQEQIQEYLDNKVATKEKLIQEALNETQILCKKYLQSRQDKAILYPVRLETDDFLLPRVSAMDDEAEEASLRGKKKEKQYNYMFFVVKYRNQGKLSSHMLFFEGFCKLFDPDYCILTDVGMKPTGNAIYRFWEYLELNPKCGGVCGYMNLKMESAADDLGYRSDGFEEKQVGCCTRFMDSILSIQRAQQFEYHFAHMIDKPFESAFKYIHVLPGAFSGYRWKALKNYPYGTEERREVDSEQYTERFFEEQEEDVQDETLMARYLKIALTEKTNKITLEDSNMYLAEDRIMCLGIHALGYDISYLPDVESSVDPVTSLTRLLGQRRRWINGSWFAFNYVRSHCSERTSLIFLIQMIYYTFVQGLQWFAPALFYIAMNLSLVAAVREYVVPVFLDFFNKAEVYNLADYQIGIFNMKNVLESIPDIINYIYILLMFAIVLYSTLVNHNNTRFKKIYYLASTVFGIYGLIVVFLLVYNTYRIFLNITGEAEQSFIIPIIYLRALIIFVIAGHAIPILWSMSCKKYVETLTSLPSYIYYIPTYINILQVFAFCRIDDLSWGTKGLDQSGEPTMDSEEKLMMKEWERRKYIFVLQYISSNIILSYIIITISAYPLVRNYVILTSMCLVVFLLIFRLLPAGLYLLFYNIRRPCSSISARQIQENQRNGEEILNALKKIELRIKELEKIAVKKKKEEEYKKASNIISKSFNNFGNKLRLRVTQHMININAIANKDVNLKKKRRKNISFRKNLKPVEEASVESDDSNKASKSRRTDKRKEDKNDRKQSSNKISQSEEPKDDKNSNYALMIPNNKGTSDMKSKLKALREKKRENKNRD